MKYTRMKLILFLTFGFFSSAVKAQFYTITTDTAKVRYIRREKPEDAYIFAQREKRNIIWVNEDMVIISF